MSSNLLSDYVRHQAEWREAKSEQYSDDSRNAQSAQALNSLAEFLEHEDASLSRSVNFINALDDYGTGTLILGEEARRTIDRYGFEFKVTNIAQHEAFLDELAAVVMEDLYAEAREQREDLSGELFDFEVAAAIKGVYLPRRYWDMRSHMSEPEIEEAIAAYSGSTEA